MASLARKPEHRATKYRQGYLKTRVWFARREQWFSVQSQACGEVVCAVCERTLTLRDGQLHHLSYAGVVEVSAFQWVAGEQHSDLVALCANDHEALHRILDKDRGWSLSNRREASLNVIVKMRVRLAQLITQKLHDEGRQ